MTKKHKALVASAARASINTADAMREVLAYADGCNARANEWTTKAGLYNSQLVAAEAKLVTVRDMNERLHEDLKAAKAENEILKSRLAKAVSKLDDSLDLKLEPTRIAIRDLILDLVRRP